MEMKYLKINKEKLITELKATNFIKKGNFKLKSGLYSNYYVDIKCLVSYPKIMTDLCNYIYVKITDYINKHNITFEDIVICGLPYAGIPFASYISLKYNIQMILLRKETKTYGTKKVFEGTLENKTHLLLIDDILTTGTSILESIDIFKKLMNNSMIISSIVILDRSNEHNTLKDNLSVVSSNTSCQTENITDNENITQNLTYIDSIFKIEDF